VVVHTVTWVEVAQNLAQLCAFMLVVEPRDLMPDN
jgi:hypothetical protein